MRSCSLHAGMDTRSSRELLEHTCAWDVQLPAISSCHVAVGEQPVVASGRTSIETVRPSSLPFENVPLSPHCAWTCFVLPVVEVVPAVAAHSTASLPALR